MDSEHYRHLGDNADKYYQEALEITELPTILQTSGHSLTRTLFYLEIGDEAGCPVFLSPEKRQWLIELTHKLNQDALRAIERIFQKAIAEKAAENLENHGLPTRIPAPPLLRLMRDVATESGCSLLDACRRVRESPGALSFRKLVHQIQAALRKGDNGVIEAERILRQLEVEANSWHQKGLQVNTLDLSAIPKIGWVFKLFGRANVSLKDHVLTGSRKYLTFISSWYDF
jgi:hypothetical protein